MTVIRLHIAAPPGPDGRLVVRGTEHWYVSRTRRARVGETVELFDGSGAKWRGSIETIESQATTLAGLSVVPTAAPVPIVLGIGLGRAEPLARVVRAAAELAVAEIVPLRCARDLGRRGESLAPLVDRLRRVAAEALRAGGIGRAPEVREPVDLAAWAERVESRTGRLVLDECGAPMAEAIVRCRAAGPSWGCLAVGPEGGFEEAEIAAVVACGFVQASLCPMPLRVETAAVGALALLRSLVG